MPVLAGQHQGEFGGLGTGLDEHTLASVGDVGQAGGPLRQLDLTAMEV
ncbi:hypothetical protein NBG84_15370 [Streptomyces sp. CWNU-1]|uniref:Uncharacterized protein n=1 Tax=Streptomyces albipurpureus TaxID=2897419 RepID=A0ABT0UMK0_9ACTN|nr:hypothetical protein [Streptomyces sp. CWNU-1]MCM2389654.1 hypothetical protein [Streptomyces sp. CWNU-1]